MISSHRKSLRTFFPQAQSQDFPATFEEVSALRVAKETGDKAAAAKLEGLKRQAWFVCGAFEDNRRHKSAMQMCSAFVGDADQPGTTREKLLAALDALEVAYVVATSISHGIGGQARYRVVIPFKEPIAPERYAAVWQWFSQRLDGMLDPGAKDPTRLNFFPRVPRDAFGHEVIVHE